MKVSRPVPRQISAAAYTAQTVDIRALAARGHGVQTIAEKLRLPPRVVERTLHVMQLMQSSPHMASDRNVLLPVALSRELAKRAALSGLTINDFVVHLLSIVVRDDMFQAILDVD